jgi:alpha-beta hydrolase superfamily lysophospholipase
VLNESHFFEHFEELIERAYEQNDGERVHIIAHSMGAPTALAFLNKKDQHWIDKYIATFLPISAPWSGTGLVSEEIIVSNRNINSFFLKKSSVIFKRLFVPY